MSRLNDFSSFGESRLNDVDSILENDGLTADQYRMDYDVDNPGIEEEIGAERRIRRFLIHIARSPGEPTRAGSDGMKASKLKYYGFCNVLDVLIEDTLIIGGKKYRVVATDRVREKTELVLERFA
jgi:hypothetical protein